ncbi:MAG: hypothetical protein K2G29_10415, partial [Muribaculaceae bacterium]|nr:hypothetical protein [Muribaculaceae bacterium]
GYDPSKNTDVMEPEYRTRAEIADDNNSGVADIIDNNNAPVEFFNLQGVKVSGTEPGLYIRRQGSNATKVIVR